MNEFMHQPGLFEGSGFTHLSYDTDLLLAGQYRLTGQLVALSLRRRAWPAVHVSRSV